MEYPTQNNTLATLALAGSLLITACGTDSGGSGNDAPPPISSDNNLAFSEPSDTARSIIGMREFLLTVTASDLSERTEYSFIVSSNSTHSPWNQVENHPAKIVRAFDSDTNSREIYFSATDQLSDTSPLLDVSSDSNITVDLSEDSNGGVPGVMNPASSYYVHAYTGAEYIASSAQITTAGYPPTLPVQYDETDYDGSNDVYPVDRFFWGMQMWNKGERFPADYADQGIADELRFYRIEMRIGEFMLFPMRFMLPVNLDNRPQDANLCKWTGGLRKMVYRIFFYNAQGRAYTHSNGDQVGISLTSTDRDGSTGRKAVDRFTDSILFHRASSIAADKHDEVDDLMFAVSTLVERELSKTEVWVQAFQQDGTLLFDPAPNCVNENYDYGYSNKVRGYIRIVRE